MVAGLLVAMPLFGCAAGQVMVTSYENENANCALLEKELGVAQARMKKLEATDSTERDIRNFPLGVGGFIIPPLGIINVVLLLTDRKSTRLNSSHVVISYAVFCLKKKNISRHLARKVN